MEPMDFSERLEHLQRFYSHELRNKRRLRSTQRLLTWLGSLDFSRGPRVGSPAPDFILLNSRGEAVRLRAFGQGHWVVLTFFRGHWCPFCRLELESMQSSHVAMRQRGARLLGISPQLPADSLLTQMEVDLDFEAVSDIGNQVAQSYQVAFTVPVEMQRQLREDGVELGVINGLSGELQLPIPAIFLIDPQGIIRFTYLEPNYTRRLGGQDVVDLLTRVQTGSPALSSIELRL